MSRFLLRHTTSLFTTTSLSFINDVNDIFTGLGDLEDSALDAVAVEVSILLSPFFSLLLITILLFEVITHLFLCIFQSPLWHSPLQ